MRWAYPPMSVSTKRTFILAWQVVWRGVRSRPRNRH